MSLVEAATIGKGLAQQARLRGDKPALVLTARKPVTFAELGQFIDGLQGQFATSGLGPGSRVGLGFPRGLDGAILSLAPLNVALPPEELAREMARLKLHALVFPEGYCPECQ